MIEADHLVAATTQRVDVPCRDEHVAVSAAAGVQNHRLTGTSYRVPQPHSIALEPSHARIILDPPPLRPAHSKLAASAFRRQRLRLGQCSGMTPEHRVNVGWRLVAGRAYSPGSELSTFRELGWLSE